MDFGNFFAFNSLMNKKNDTPCAALALLKLIANAI